MAARTKIDWSASGWIFNDGGSVAATRGSSLRTPSTTESVEALPALRIVSSAARLPFCRTMLVWGEKPSRT